MKTRFVSFFLRVANVVFAGASLLTGAASSAMNLPISNVRKCATKKREGWEYPRRLCCLFSCLRDKFQRHHERRGPFVPDVHLCELGCDFVWPLLPPQLSFLSPCTERKRNFHENHEKRSHLHHLLFLLPPHSLRSCFLVSFNLQRNPLQRFNFLFLRFGFLLSKGGHFALHLLLLLRILLRMLRLNGNE